MGASTGWYGRHVFPAIHDWINFGPELPRLRSEVLAATRGRTLEIGFGSGLNLSHYPATLSELVAVEPNPGMLKRAQPRLADLAFSVHVVAGVAEHLPFDDQSFDTVVSTWTLCSVDDPLQSLAEMRRVLRDDGRLLVLEHGLAEDQDVARWQKRLDWVNTIGTCGCHLARPVGTTLDRAGFRLDTSRRFFLSNTPRILGWATIGVGSKS